MSQPLPQFEIPAGGALSRDLQAVDYFGNPSTVFLGTDTLSGVIWPAGATADSKLSVTPTLAWIVAASGTWRLQLHSADTAAIAPGNYKIQVKATRGSDAAVLLDTDLVVSGTGGTLAAPAATAVSGATATSLALVTTLYCTDEHIAVRCGPDFTALLSSSQTLAAGSDGVFLAADPWTLTSVSNNFTTQGVAVGTVVWLRKPAGAFPAGGILMAVAAVNTTSLTLRRLGLPTNSGMAPAPAAGLTGVDFQIATFGPQIEEATYDLNQRYTIDAAIAGRSPSNLSDLRPLRRACVAMVLADRYSDETRTAAGDYAAKLASVKAELDELRAKLELRWSNRPTDTTRTNWFSTRIVR